ncbi:TetR/AcrR family transcriptional regulator [Actinocatenispora rupis]|uniref:TetR family transcriptional regulator n=1 Tax=Actinocatenispora rupis TaxID=519421 RepID=A0A8J3JD52_9ACTN|nr:TetR family transcriptional regulator [Actinocatenispora rupis]GID14544.1 TetR family transcriptional regulator [Actinocatenispora rupis]
MPAPNLERRRALADAAIELLVSAGVHGVTHRAVERRAGLPTGTASNYFRTREDLLVAVTRRVLELHNADLAAAAATHPRRGTLVEQMTDLIAGSLYEAASDHRDRYVAIFELWLESQRRPALAAAMHDLILGAEQFTARHHDDLDLAVPRDRIPVLLRLYGGALFTMVSGPEQGVTPAVARDLASALVRGALA